MLETATTQPLREHYAQAHHLRARAFADAARALLNFFRTIAGARTHKKGPRQMAQPQSC